MDNKYKTRVQCNLTSCKFNTACCIACTKNEKTYCTKPDIKIDLDLEKEDSFDFTCMSFKSGGKPVLCSTCKQIKTQEGDVSLNDILDGELDDDIELDILDFDE